MSKILYSWRCKMEVPMLEDHEWDIVEPLLSKSIEQIQRYRQENGVSLAKAREKGFGEEARRLYERLTGFKETNVSALLHHRVRLYGPPCVVCGKPLRTPSASICAACGARVGE